MRLVIALFVASTTLGLAACTAEDDQEPIASASVSSEPVASIPIEQRFLTADEAPGSKPDPEETRHTFTDLDGFLAALRERAVDPVEEEMNEVFEGGGFRSAGIDTRFYGETHTPGESTHVVSSFVELGSEEAATAALDWFEEDLKKPCPGSCAVEIETFEVDGFTDGRGVHLLATAAAIEDRGTPDQHPFENYWVGFTDGAIAYSVDLFGRPGSVSEDELLEIARAYSARVSGA